VANANSSNVSILLGNGAGSFSTAANFPSITTPLSITTADFNHDGKLDIAATDGADSMCVLLNTSTTTVTASFGAPVTTYFAGGTQSPYQGSIVSADFNGDGNADVAASDYALGSGYASVLLGTGTGSFNFDGNFATGSNPFGIVTADFNMDGKPDLATANESSNNVTILLNTPTHTVTVAASAISLCSGNSSVLTASGSTTYNWSTSATTSTVSVAPTVSTTYYVSDGVGCSNTASITINVATTSAPSICMVTTDSATNYKYNIVYWDKTGLNNVDSFIVYRYNPIIVNYARIGAVSNSVLSEFIDTAFSIGGPNGGNPAYGSWEYKLAIRDTCGNIGAMSPYHQTMFVQQNNSNFSWNAYVGGGTSLPTGYSFLRDDNNTGNFHVLANLANTSVSTTDPNYSSFPNGNWRIDALGFSCTPTVRLAANNSIQSTYAKAHSNTTKTEATGIEKYNANNTINLYPNPSNGSFIIEPSSITKQTMQMFDVTGKLVLSQAISSRTSVDASNLNEGVYNISLQSNEGVVNKRLVIVR
jgi:hypothetical protein